MVANFIEGHTATSARAMNHANRIVVILGGLDREHGAAFAQLVERKIQ